MTHPHSIRNRLFSFVIAYLVCLVPALPSILRADTIRNDLMTVRVGAYENSPKIYSDKSGEIVGLFPDVLKMIALKEGWELKYVKGSWSQCLERLEKNEIDLMVDVAFSEKRAEKYAFTSETFLVNWAEVYTTEKNQIASLIDLGGKKIAVMKGSIHTDGDGGIKMLRKRFDIDCQFTEVETYRDVFSQISEGKVDAGIANRIFGSLFSEEFGVVKTPIIFNPRQLKFALPKDGPMTAVISERIDSRLQALKQDPDSIYNRALYVYLSGLPRDMLFTALPDKNEITDVVLTEREKKWIIDHPEIRLGVDPEFAPFEYIGRKGDYSGISSDYVYVLNQRLGLNMKPVQSLSWAEAVRGAEERKIDVLPCVGITTERKEFLRYSKAYIQFHRIVITRADYPFITGLDDLKDKRVSVQSNTSHEGFLREHTDIASVPYDTLEKALLAVSQGQADAFVGNVASSTYWIKKSNLTNLKVAAPVSRETQTLHFAVRKDWPELVGILNKGLASISNDKEQSIRRRWVNVEYEPGIAMPLFWRYLLQIAGIALVIILLMSLWSYSLKKEIRKRKGTEKQLFEANKNLKKLDRLKSMFIASMSHELRTPLNSIIGFTGIILQEMTGPLNVKQKDHLGRVYQASKHLLSLITDVIDISKIEAGRIDAQIESVNIAELVNEAADATEPQMKLKPITLVKSVPENINIMTDRKRLLQSVINYMSNAVKYTEEGAITVSAEEENDRVKIQVADTGIGIPEDEMPVLFEAFERIDSHLKVKAGGTGLGLYLTRKLVTEILGGEVFAKSMEGEGSIFGLDIPVKRSTPGTETEPFEEDEYETGAGH